MAPLPAFIPAFILAGGRSSRFGTDKALYPSCGGDGLPLAAQVAAALQTAGLQVWLIRRAAPPGGDPSPGIGASAHPALRDLPLLLEPAAPDRHPLYGVAAGLSLAKDLSATSAIFCPCDLPDLSPAHIRPLLPRPSRLLGHPLLCHLPIQMADPARAAAAQGRSVRQFLSEIPEVEAEAGAPELRNRNTPGGR